MKKFSRSLLSLSLALSLAGCGTAGAVSAALPAEDASAGARSEAYSPADYVDAERKDKSETVYIDASATGQPEKVTVEAVLKNPGGSDPIPDFSSLTSIRNTEGDEEFTQNGSELLWQNHGADIHYKGTADASALPVGVQIDYLLNGEPIQPEKLIGQSGHVTLRFTYQNRETRTVTESGRDYTVSVPFAAVSMLSLPSDSFYNVRVDHGQCMQLNDSTLVIGYALPGLSDSLQLSGYKLTEDTEIPETVEITCDTSDFSLEFTATVFTPGLLADANLSDLSDADDFIQDMDDAKDGINDLADGTRELHDGVQELYDGTVEYTDGVSEVNDAVQKLIDALRDAADSDSDMIQGVSALSGGWLSVLGTFLGDPDLTYENCEARLPQALYAYTGSLYQQKVQAALQQLAAGMLSWPQADEDGSSVSVPAELQPVFGGETALPAALVQTLAGQLFADSITPCYQQRLLANAALALAEKNITAPTEQQQAEALSGALAAWVGSRYALLLFGQTEPADFLADTLTEAESAALDSLLRSAAEPLSQSLAALVSGTGSLPGSLSDAFNTMADTIGELKNGTQQLSDAGDDLKEGIEALLDGTGELADGVHDFQQDSLPALTDLAGNGLRNLIDRLRASQKADLSYTSFSGLQEGKTGSVCFIFETAELKKE